MPFGLTNAPASFQSLINNTLQEYLDDFVVAYLDDVLIFSKTYEEYVQHVRKVLTKLREKGLPVKLEKCEFHKHEVPFLGYIVSDQGLKMSPDKIKDVLEWPIIICSCLWAQKSLSYSCLSVGNFLDKLSSGDAKCLWGPKSLRVNTTICTSTNNNCKYFLSFTIGFSDITAAMSDVCFYEPRFKVALCRKCQTGVVVRNKKAKVDHFRGRPHFLKGPALQRVQQYLDSLELANIDEVQYPSDHEQPVPPVPCLPIHNAFECEHCSHAPSVNAKNSRAHVSQRHNIVSGRSNRGLRNCRVQTLFRETHHLRYFKVKPFDPHTLPSRTGLDDFDSSAFSAS